MLAVIKKVKICFNVKSKTIKFRFKFRIFIKKLFSTNRKFKTEIFNSFEFFKNIEIAKKILFDEKKILKA